MYSISNSLRRLGTSHIFRGRHSTPCAEAIFRQLSGGRIACSATSTNRVPLEFHCSIGRFVGVGQIPCGSTLSRYAGSFVLGFPQREQFRKRFINKKHSLTQRFLLSCRTLSASKRRQQVTTQFMENAHACFR